MSGHPLIIFIHSLKTGGTTLRDILARQYGETEVLSVARHKDLHAFVRQQKAPLVQARAAQGHMSFGLHALVDRPSTYITLIREPVDRLVSLYYFAVQKPGRSIGREIGAYLSSFEAFLKSPDIAEVDNEQTRRLSGVWPEVGRCTPAMLEIAKNNLRTHFAVVGVTERFDESVLLMQQEFGWEQPFYVRQKVTERRPAREDMSQDMLELVERRNMLDVELHRFASQQLDAAVRRQPSEFAAQVAQFRDANAGYGGRLAAAVGNG